MGRALAAAEGRLDLARLDDLLGRAAEQARELEMLRAGAAQRVISDRGGR